MIKESGYKQLENRRKKLTEANQPTQVVISIGPETNRTYYALVTVMNKLNKAGVITNITQGGISLSITNERTYNKAMPILKQHGLEMELGETFSASFQKVVKSERKLGSKF